MYPFTARRASLHLTSLFFTYPINPSLHFTLPFISTPPFPSLFIAFTSPRWFFTFLTLVLKICVLPWEVPIAPPCSWFQSVMVLFTTEYFPTSVFIIGYGHDHRRHHYDDHHYHRRRHNQ